MTVIGNVIHTRIGNGRSALITVPIGMMTFSEPEAAVVDGIVGRRRQALVGDLRAGDAGRQAGIVEAAHLLADVRQVDRHLVAALLDAHLDRDALADVDAVVVHEGFGFVDAIGDGARVARAPRPPTDP